MIIKNIIFDFGGVLYDIRYQNIADAFARYGVTDFEKLYSKTHQTDTIDRFEEGKLSAAEFRQYLRSLTEVPLSDAQLDECWNAIMIGFPAQNERLLKKVRLHYRIFLFSNTNAINYEYFVCELRRQFGYDIFDILFEKAYFSQILHIRKPKIEGFQHIIRENNLIPEETLFIDDSPQHLESARQCRLNTCHLKAPQKVTDLFDADFFIAYP